MAIKAVIFDWGGTLTPWHTVDFDDAWHAYARIYAPDRSAELAAKLIEAERLLWYRSRDHQRSGRLVDLLRGVGVTPEGDRHERAIAAYLDFWEPHTYLDPDALGLFTALKERDLRIGVLSNTLWPRAYHDEVFRRDRALALLDGAVYSSEICWTKPHPAAFAAALQAIGDPDPASTVFVGDRLYDDIYGAAGVGMRTIHVPHSAIPDHQRGHTEGVPDAVVQRLGEITDVLDRWHD